MKFVLFILILSVIFCVGTARPTFDKIAEALLDMVDDHYVRPSYAHRAPEPLIQEGYEHGYDYYYGNGATAGNAYHKRPLPYAYVPPQKVPIVYVPPAYPVTAVVLPHNPQAYPAPVQHGYAASHSYRNNYYGPHTGSAGYESGGFHKTAYGQGSVVHPGPPQSVQGYKNRGY